MSNSVMNICVLRSGGDFKPEHVQRLSRMVPDLVCLSDVPVDGVRVIPLKYDWPGWWSKMEMFRPDIAGNLFFLDLDTTVLTMPKMPLSDAVLYDFGDPSVIGSGLMYLTETKRRMIWEDWIKCPEKHMAAHTKWPAGDQGYLLPHLKNALRWQNLIRVYSYKIHCKKAVPEDAEVICYHGKPRPWELER